MRKHVSTFFIVLFSICICLPHALFLVCKNYIDTNNYENRKLNTMPVIGEVEYGEFAKDFEAFYNDHIAFRNQLIELRNRIGYYLFRSELSDQVLIGKDGWLYLQDNNQGNTIRDYLGDNLLKDEELEEIASNLQYNKAYFDSQGIEFVVLILPNKARIYDEYLPDYLGAPAEEYAVRQIVDYVSQNTDVNIIYPYETLYTAKNKQTNHGNDSGRILYHKSDTHWNNLGAYIGAQALLEHFDIELPALEDDLLVIREEANTIADLADMLHMKGDFIYDEVDYSVQGYDNNDLKLIQDDFGRVIEYTSNALDNRTIYIYRDSFATELGPYIGANFGRTYMRHYETYSYDDIESVQPDIFVLETVERTSPYKLSTFKAAGN